MDRGRVGMSRGPPRGGSRGRGGFDRGGQRDNRSNGGRGGFSGRGGGRDGKPDDRFDGRSDRMGPRGRGGPPERSGRDGGGSRAMSVGRDLPDMGGGRGNERRDMRRSHSGHDGVMDSYGPVTPKRGRYDSSHPADGYRGRDYGPPERYPSGGYEGSQYSHDDYGRGGDGYGYRGPTPDGYSGSRGGYGSSGDNYGPRSDRGYGGGRSAGGAYQGHSERDYAGRGDYPSYQTNYPPADDYRNGGDPSRYRGQGYSSRPSQGYSSGSYDSRDAYSSSGYNSYDGGYSAAPSGGSYTRKDYGGQDLYNHR